METVTQLHNINTPNWSHKLGTIGGIVTDDDDIAQCYETIFKTQKGTVVLNPNLGWDALKFMARPLNQVAHQMRTELMRELNWQEPRAEVTDIVFAYENTPQGNLIAKVEYINKLTQEARSLEVSQL